MLPVLEIQLIITGQAIVHCVILRYAASDIKYIKFKGWNIFHVDNPFWWEADQLRTKGCQKQTTVSGNIEDSSSGFF